MKTTRWIILFVLIGIGLFGCGPSKSEIATSEAETQAAIDVLATDIAGTQQSIQAMEDAAEKTTTAEFNQGATKTHNIELAGTRRAATEEAEIIAQTQAASTMYDKIVELNTYGYINDVNGKYYELDDFNESMAMINYIRPFPTGLSPKNFVIRADASWDSASDNANWFNSGCGFIFHRADQDNYYLVYLGLDGTVYFARKYRDEWANLGYSIYGPVGIPEGEANLMLVVEDNTFTFFVNDERVRTQPDNVIPEGALALTLVSGTNAGFGTRCKMENLGVWVMD